MLDTISLPHSIYIVAVWQHGTIPFRWKGLYFFHDMNDFDSRGLTSPCLAGYEIGVINAFSESFGRDVLATR
jgi:hypothetical protein